LSVSSLRFEFGVQLAIPKIICFANAKGGVGKTKSCIALADAIIGVYARNVLVVDLDPLSSASLFMLQGNISKLNRAESQHITMDYYFESVALEDRKISLTQFMLPKIRLFAGSADIRLRYGSLLASSPRLGLLEERFLFNAKGANLGDFHQENLPYQNFMLRLAHNVKQDIAEACEVTGHEFVVIDTAAGAGLFAFIAMLISDIIIVPTIPDNMSLIATGRFIGQIRQFELETKQFVPRSMLLFSKVQPGFSSHIHNMDRLSRYDSSDFLSIPFLQKDLISDLDTSQTPLLTFENKYGAAAGNVKAFAREILGALESQAK
jgi:cellulose biosynthesis protein BcsQ